MFHGSFKPEDVTLLLQPITDVPVVTKEEKEALIAAGGHYSDVVVSESVPSVQQRATYLKALSHMEQRLALGVNSLAFDITHDACFGDEIVLISLVRAGTPLGVLLKRAISRQTHKQVFHYGVSIIRDRGIDPVAMKYIMEKHGQSAEIYFVDGWTGKGTIFKSLKKSLLESEYWSERDLIKTVVFSDPARTAWLSTTNEDLLLPFGVLNSTVAGLISRTVYREDGYHGVFVFDNLEEWDWTNKFIESVDEIMNQHKDAYSPPLKNLTTNLNLSAEVVQNIKVLTDTYDDNKIKPSIAECTRALHRRVPKMILVSDTSDPDLQLILSLARSQGVQVNVANSVYPYKAVAILV